MIRSLRPRQSVEFRPAALLIDYSLIVLAAVLFLLPSLLAGAPEGHDAHIQIVYAETFTAQMASGDLYPRWIDALWHGAGGADFYFYAPLPYWFTGAIRLLACPGCGVDQFLPLAGVVLLALSGLGFRLLGGRFASRWAANLAAILYMGLPYHLGADWYDRLAFGEFTAIAILPWLLTALLDSSSGRGGAIRLALLTGLLAFSHLPTTMIAAAGGLALLLFSGQWAGWRQALPTVAAAGLGLGLAAVYWFPAVTLLDSVRGDQLAQTHTQWRSAILKPANFGGNAFLDIIWLAFIALSLAALAAIAAAWRLHRAPARTAVVLLALVWLMNTPLTALLWDATPIGRVQFPWRFFVLADLGFSLAMLLAADTLIKRSAGGLRQGVAGAALASTVLVVALAHPLVRGIQEPKVPNSVTVPLAAGAIPWLPRETSPVINVTHPLHIYGLARAIPDWPLISLTVPGISRVVSQEHRRMEFEVELSEPGGLVIRRTFWRHWRLREAETGIEIPMRPLVDFPLITADLPAGRSRYILELPVLTRERIGLLISAVSFFLLIFWRGLIRRQAAEVGVGRACGTQKKGTNPLN